MASKFCWICKRASERANTKQICNYSVSHSTTVLICRNIRFLTMFDSFLREQSCLKLFEYHFGKVQQQLSQKTISNIDPPSRPEKIQQPTKREKVRTLAYQQTMISFEGKLFALHQKKSSSYRMKFRTYSAIQKLFRKCFFISIFPIDTLSVLCKVMPIKTLVVMAKRDD